MRIGILGAGGHGKVVLDLLKAAGQFEFVGFFDHCFRQGAELETTIIGSDNDLIYHWREFEVKLAVAAIGDNKIRERFFQQLIESGLEMPVLVHPRATVSSKAEIGPGTVICGHAFIGPGVVIGANCIINTAANIDHDCLLADHIHICPGVNLAGGIKIGLHSMIGTGTNVIPGIRIGSGVIVGAGSVIIADVPDNITVAGVPARLVHRKEEN